MPNSHQPLSPSLSLSLSRGIAWRPAAVLALCACIGAVAAQEYSFRNYAQADGLQGLSINCLYADRHGVVWACTELGLHRYERERFEQIGADTGFGSPLVHAIAEDRRQRMWVGTSNAL
ncbi:two-component regulator propeller domain-containing protein [Xanthomonas translucens]|nr:two-component regulator propeller domain-containing protein [Xanthomonas translucens]